MTQQDPILPAYDAPLEAVLIFGPPGSGKGTLGKFLSSAGNHYHLSSGDIFRSLSPESPAGQLYFKYASKGLLLPDEITIKIWYHYVQGLIATNRYFPGQQLILLDGIPRTTQQAMLLQKYITVVKIIVLEIHDSEALVKRIQRRALIEKRTDDLDSNVLKTRMEVYENDTAKVLTQYPEHLISRFDGTQKPLEVLRDVLIELSPILSR